MQSHQTCHFGAEKKCSSGNNQNETILEKNLYIESVTKACERGTFVGWWPRKAS